MRAGEVVSSAVPLWGCSARNSRTRKELEWKARIEAKSTPRVRNDSRLGARG